VSFSELFNLGERGIVELCEEDGLDGLGHDETHHHQHQDGPERADHVAHAFAQRGLKHSRIFCSIILNLIFHNQEFY
jgi:hypothetical protein